MMTWFVFVGLCTLAFVWVLSQDTVLRVSPAYLQLMSMQLPAEANRRPVQMCSVVFATQSTLPGQGAEAEASDQEDEGLILRGGSTRRNVSAHCGDPVYRRQPKHGQAKPVYKAHRLQMSS